VPSVQETTVARIKKIQTTLAGVRSNLVTIVT
jgi:hypothetical protein